MISNNSFNMENVNRQENFDKYQFDRIKHWNISVTNADTYAGCGKYYHARLNQIYGLIIPQNSKVLELGCGQGDLLASLVPTIGVGVDFP